MIRCVASSGVAVYLEYQWKQRAGLMASSVSPYARLKVYMDRTILIANRRASRSTAGPKSPDFETWGADITGSYIMITENDKSPIWRVCCGLCAVCIGFRLHYRYRYGLSKCSCFRSVTINIYRYRLPTCFAGIVPKRFESPHPTLVCHSSAAQPLLV